MGFGAILFLQSWWSRTYNRPLKDPILQQYSLEELLYEYMDHIERDKADRDQVEQTADKIEEEKLKSALSWAEEEEAKELAALKSAGITPIVPKDDDAWMKQQIEKEKEQYGDTFGEDIHEDF